MVRLSLKRRVLYISIIYLSFVALLAAIEIGTRLTLPPVSSLELFVATPQQKAQVANAQQSGIFEGDPLLLWRLKPNLRHVVWDYTVVSTNAQNLRADQVIKAKAPGAIRIVCLGDSVTFGYRVPPVWPERPTDYDHKMGAVYLGRRTLTSDESKTEDSLGLDGCHESAGCRATLNTTDG